MAVFLVVESVFKSVVIACNSSLSLLSFKSISLAVIVVVGHHVSLDYIKCINNGETVVINK